MNKPNIKWIGSPNFGLPRGTHGRYQHKVVAIVDHIMSGSLLGTDSWFLNSASQASSHFGIGKNGEIHQYVSLDDVSWANGIVNRPNWNLLQSGVNPNYTTITIEHEGDSGDVFTEAQYNSTLALHKWLIAELGIEVNTDTIIGHYRINSVDKANCPGTGFPWDRLFKDLKNGDDFQMEHAVVYFTDRDFSSARIISDKLGGCAMFCRNATSNIHPDAKASKHLVIVGGPECTDHSNVDNKTGDHAEDTAILAAQYAKTL